MANQAVQTEHSGRSADQCRTIETSPSITNRSPRFKLQIGETVRSIRIEWPASEKPANDEYLRETIHGQDRAE